MSLFHLAQINIGRIKAALEDPVMHGFVSRLDEINALADSNPGFVWRLQTSEGNATYLRPYNDDRILVNMSVWETVEALKQYVYRSAHAELLRDRQRWFEVFVGAYVGLWWIPKGTVPTVEEAKQRLEYLETHGPTPRVFSLRQIFPAPDTEQGVTAGAIDLSS